MLSIGGRHFFGPYSFDDWTPTHDGGIYAILSGTGLMLSNDELLYLGLSRNFADGRVSRYHYAYRSWMENSEPRGNLFIATHPMPFASELQLALEEEKLLKLLNPVCNQLHSPVMRSLFR